MRKEKSELERIRNYYIERASNRIAEAGENAIISALNNRPRYLRWIPKKFYVKHFIEVHYHNTRPLVLPVKNGLKIETEFRVYDKLRKKYTLSDLAKKVGLNRKTLSDRLNRGRDINRACEEPVHKEFKPKTHW